MRRGSMRTRPSASSGESKSKSGGGRDAHSLFDSLFPSSPLSFWAFLRSIKPQRRTSDFLYICQTSWYLILREWELLRGRFLGMKNERCVLFAGGWRRRAGKGH